MKKDLRKGLLLHRHEQTIEKREKGRRTKKKHDETGQFLKEKGERLRRRKRRRALKTITWNRGNPPSKGEKEKDHEKKTEERGKVSKGPMLSERQRKGKAPWE